MLKNQVNLITQKMNIYTVRIELHSSQYNPDFETLHSSMEREGFKKTITADGGKTYHLPRGEYYISTTKDCSQVLDASKRAVSTTRQSAEIIVTEAKAIRWDGLIEKK